MKTLATMLADQNMFRGMSEADLELIAECGTNVRFNEGERIFREGEPADHFYLIRHGRVGLDFFMPQRGAVTTQTLGEGDVLGWSWLFEPYKWHYDSHAVLMTRAIAFNAACLRGKIGEDPRLGYELMRRFAHVVIDRLQQARLQILDVYGDD